MPVACGCAPCAGGLEDESAIFCLRRFLRLAPLPPRRLDPVGERIFLVPRVESHKSSFVVGARAFAAALTQAGFWLVAGGESTPEMQGPAVCPKFRGPTLDTGVNSRRRWEWSEVMVRSL